MSYITVNLTNVILNQYRFKLKAYLGTLTTLIFVQLIAILLSLGGVGGSGAGNGSISININDYSGDMVTSFTVFWAFITGILITTKSYDEVGYTFVTNRLSNNLANILFLFTASIFAGITAILSRYVLMLVFYFKADTTKIMINTNLTIKEYTFGVLGIICTLFLFSSIGYFFGKFVKIHKILPILTPIILLGFVVMMGSEDVHILVKIEEFYFREASFPLFLIKSLGVTGIMFALAILFSNQREVRES